MKHLSGKNIMWAPMYDGLDKYGVVNFTNLYLEKYFGGKCLPWALRF